MLLGRDRVLAAAVATTCEIVHRELVATRARGVRPDLAGDDQGGLLRQVSARSKTSGDDVGRKRVHWMVPVPSRTCRKCSLPLERRPRSQPCKVTLWPAKAADPGDGREGSRHGRPLGRHGRQRNVRRSPGGALTLRGGSSTNSYSAGLNSPAERGGRPGSHEEEAAMSVSKRIYMDNHATTPMDPRVLDAMLPYFREHFGNAASRNHSFGWEAESAVDQAREQVADVHRRQGRRRSSSCPAPPSPTTSPSRAWSSSTRTRATTSSPPRPSTRPCSTPARRSSARRSRRVTYLPVDQQGRVSAEQVREAITDKTVLISIMAANNEIGTIQPIARDRQGREGEGHPLPQRRDAGLRQAAARRRRARRRPPLRHRPQDLRPEGLRLPVGPLEGSARAPDGADGRRRPRARHALRDA